MNEVMEVAKFALLGIVSRRFTSLPSPVRSRFICRSARSNCTAAEGSALNSINDHGRCGSHGQLRKRAGVIAAAGQGARAGWALRGGCEAVS